MGEGVGSGGVGGEGGGVGAEDGDFANVSISSEVGGVGHGVAGEFGGEFLRIAREDALR